MTPIREEGVGVVEEGERALVLMLARNDFLFVLIWIGGLYHET